MQIHSTWTLTTGADNIVGTSSNDSINLLVDGTTPANSTLTVFDKIDGGAGTDRLNVTTVGTVANVLNGADITGIEVVAIRNTAATTAGTATIVATGLTGVVADRGTGDIVVTALANNASFTASGVTGAAVIAAAYATAATNAVVNLSGSTLGTVTLTGGGLTAATITTSGTASTTGIIDVAAAKAITIDAASNLTAASIATAGTTAALTVKGGATRVNVGTLDTDIVTVDASGLTGGLTATLNANVTSFKGGAGADVVTTAAVTGAAGSIDGGAGSADRLVVAATADVDTAGEIARYVNFEELATAGQNLDVSTFTGITKLVASGVVTLDKVSAALAGNILVNGGATLTANVVDATTVGQLDKLSLTVSDEVTTPSTITLANIVAAGVETININAVDATIVTALLGATAMTNLNVTGAADVSITTGALPLNVNTKIDASAATGAVTVNATDATANGLEIVGSTGSKVNTLTGSALNDKLTGGAGNDVLSGLAGNDIIIGGAGNDRITGGAGADALTGGAGNDTFVIATRADTQSAAPAADTTAANIDRIVDFAGNGASAGDTIQLGVAANVFGTALVFTNATTAAVTAVTVATAADFTALAAAVQAASAGVASSGTVAQVYDVTVTAGNLAGRYVIVNDETAAVAATDTIVSITGVSGALNAQDFTFA